MFQNFWGDATFRCGAVKNILTKSFVKDTETGFSKEHAATCTY